MSEQKAVTRKESLGQLLGDAFETKPGKRAKTEFFNLDVDPETWRTVDMPADGGVSDFPDVVRQQVDLHAYFFGRLDTAIGFNTEYFSLLLMRLAPGFTIPRHYHETDQLVIVLEGEARQGARRLRVGDVYFTPANHPYSLTAGPEGCRTVEVRKHSLHELQTHWIEGSPDRWVELKSACDALVVGL